MFWSIAGGEIGFFYSVLGTEPDVEIADVVTPSLCGGTNDPGCARIDGVRSLTAADQLSDSEPSCAIRFGTRNDNCNAKLLVFRQSDRYGVIDLLDIGADDELTVESWIGAADVTDFSSAPETPLANRFRHVSLLESLATNASRLTPHASGASRSVTPAADNPQMATTRRSKVVNPLVPAHHCVSRCVRRALLRGKDPVTGTDLDHRAGFVCEKLAEFAGAFAIEVCAYAIMEDHWHVVLRPDTERASGLSDEAILRRYAKISRRLASEARALSGAAQAKKLAVLRERLTDISWFMRFINEAIARDANREDKTTGRFWEGRFKSQALLDDGALLVAAAYVDLNPVRVGERDRPDKSAFTSFEQRRLEADGKRCPWPAVPLASFLAESNRSGSPRLAMRFDDFCRVLEWTAKASREKPGAGVRAEPPGALAKAGIRADAFLETMVVEGGLSGTAVGTLAAISKLAESQDRKWFSGKTLAARLFSTDTSP